MNTASRTSSAAWRWSMAPALIGVFVLAATGCSGTVSGGGGGSANGGGSSSGGAGGATVTETHGCPDIITTDMPCYDPGLKCDYPVNLVCGYQGSFWGCYDWADTWQWGHIDMAPCTCPDSLPSDGDPCDPAVDETQCTYQLGSDCSPPELVATCTLNEGSTHTWSVPTAVCP